MDNGNEPAYPVTEDSPSTGPRAWFGLTKREYFAAMAMQGFLSGENMSGGRVGDPWDKQTARESVAMADALLAELCKGEAQ